MEDDNHSTYCWTKKKKISFVLPIIVFFRCKRSSFDRADVVVNGKQYILYNSSTEAQDTYI